MPISDPNFQFGPLGLLKRNADSLLSRFSKPEGGKIYRTDGLNREFTFEYTNKGVKSHITLFVNPEEFTQSEPARITVTQTKGGVFVDHFGRGLKTITLRGVTGFNERNDKGRKVSGHKHFLELRQLIRDWTENSKSNPAEHELRFFNWADEEAHQIVVNQFSLLRSSGRPLLYQYNMTITCIKDLQFKQLVETDDGVALQYLMDPPLRAKLAQKKLVADTLTVRGLMAKVFDMSKFTPATNSWAAAFATGKEVYNTAKGIFTEVSTTISGIEDLARDIGSYVNGSTSFIVTPFEAVRDLAVVTEDVINEMCAAESIPHELVRTFREMQCAIKSLAESLFGGFTNPSQFDGASNCGTTLGIPEAPVAKYDNSFTATAQIAPTRSMSQNFSLAATRLTLRETPDVVTGVFLGTDVSRLGLNYLQSVNGREITLTTVPNSAVVVDYMVRQATTTNMITLKAAKARIIKADDTIERIALEEYGDPDRWKQIATFNGLVYPFVVDYSFEKELKATGTVRFYRLAGYEGAVPIPAGTLLTVPAYQGTKTIKFLTTQYKLLDLAVSEIDVPVQAVLPGSIGNVSTGNITAFPSLSGVTYSWAASSRTLSDSALGFIAAGFVVGMKITTAGFSNVENNNTWTIVSVTAGSIVVDEATMVDEAAASAPSQSIALAGISRIANTSALIGGKIWKVARPGDIILIPETSTDVASSIVVGAKESYEELFGIDVFLNRFGEMEVSNEELYDIRRVFGVKNLAQALRNRIATRLRFYYHHAEYGSDLDYYVGKKNEARWQDLVRMDIRMACLLDPRIDSLKSFTMEIYGDRIAIEFDAVPINEHTSLPVNILV